MKKMVIVMCLCMFVGSCGLLQRVGESGEVTLVLDPNAVGPWLNAAYATGQASQAIGIATGNPALVGGGILLAVVASILGVGYLRKK